MGKKNKSGKHYELDDVEIIRICDKIFSSGGSWSDINKYFNLRNTSQSVQIRYYKAKLNTKKSDWDTQKKVKTLEKINRDLERKLESVDTVYEYIDRVVGVLKYRNDNIDISVREFSDNKVLVPVLFLTDIHMGEVVKSEETGVDNDYNSDIAKERINYAVDKFIDTSINDLSKYNMHGCVMPFGGDMITGNLHDLAEFNDLSPVSQVMDLIDILDVQIKKVLNSFGKVYIPAVTGNHGRMEKYRVKTKGRVNDSLEYLLYKQLQKRYIDNKDVIFSIDKADFINFSINGRVFRLEHGDSFRGGGGIGGIQVPIKRGIAKKQQTAVAANKPFDTMLIGHFHQHFISDELIIGNSIKGYDEFSKSLSLPYQDPGVTSFYVDTNGKITFPNNIYIKTSKKSELGVKVF